MTPQEKMDLDEMRMKVSEAEKEVGELEDQMYTDVGPKGKFSEKGMNMLIDSANKLLPLFGIEDKFPRVTGDSTSFTPELTRLLNMFADAFDDAIEEDMLQEDASFSGFQPKTDSDLSVLSGKLTMAAKSKPFSKFLSRPKKAEGMAPKKGGSPIVGEEMEEEGNVDKLFMERM